MLNSIRRRLPLSYAAIALLATLALGAVLLLAVRGYYLRVERDYLMGNAQAIGFSLAQLLEDGESADVLQAQMVSFSFLSQTRVRLLDTGGNEVASAETSGRYIFELLPPPGEDIQSPGEQTETGERIRRYVRIYPDHRESADAVATPVLPARLNRGALPRTELAEVLAITVPRIAGAPYPLGSRGGSGASGTASDQVVQLPIYDSQGSLLGFIELSQGPAYAREVVGSVAWGWAIASAVAVALAAVVGWFISRRLTTPLAELTAVSASLAGGDLRARADFARKDELGTLARSFNQMAGQVEDTVANLRRFVSDAAHEIHTPLTALRTNLELAHQDGTLPEQSLETLNEHVALAQAQAERLQALTDGLLDLSRLESGTQAQDFVPIPLLSLVQELSEPYASRAEQAGLHFELSTRETPIAVLGDEAQLSRALSNLLDNAIKFTPEGGSICLGLRRRADTAVIWVEDTGIGIPEDDLPHLFERFHRGRNATRYPGSGLGLAIVKTIIEGHGGRVEAERTAHGARFNVWIAVSGPVGQQSTEDL